jgi:hypothetical protein
MSYSKSKSCTSPEHDEANTKQILARHSVCHSVTVSDHLVSDHLGVVVHRCHMSLVLSPSLYIVVTVVTDAFWLKQPQVATLTVAALDIYKNTDDCATMSSDSSSSSFQSYSESFSESTWSSE